MFEFLICTVITTILNIVLIWTGYLLGTTGEKPMKPDFNRIFFRNKSDELEEAYIPEED